MPTAYRWVTVFGRVNDLGAEPGTLQTCLSQPYVVRLDEYLAKAGGVNRHTACMAHQPVHVVSQCSLNAWLVAG